MAKTDQLQASVYFSTPVYSIEIPEWVDHVDKVCNKYIKAAKENNKKAIKEWRKNNKEHVIKYNKKIYAENKENILNNITY